MRAPTSSAVAPPAVAEEIAELAVYPGGNLSAYTTGHVHVIDGGPSL